MKKNKINIKFIILLVFAFIFLLGCSRTTNSKENDNACENFFTVIISKEAKGYTEKEIETVAEKKVKVEKEKNAMTYLRDNFEIKEKGGFIHEIEGIHNVYPIAKSKMTEEQKKNNILGIDWFLYLNDEKTKVGANDLYLESGDVLRIDFHEWDKREFSSK